MAATVLLGFVGLYLVGRLLVLGFQWALSPLGLPALFENTIAILLAALAAYLAWRVFRRWGPRGGPALKP